MRRAVERELDKIMENPALNAKSSLDEKAKQIRYEIIKACFEVGMERKAHPGPALSIVEILIALYYGIMNIDPRNPQWQDRDRFILSKGHGCIALYCILADRGFFSKDHLTRIRRLGGILQGHPDMRKTPGIDMTAGSLGNGLGIGVGMALAPRMDGRKYNIYVLMGDGELDEGAVWEAAECACKYSLDNLVAIVDANGFQSCGSTDELMPLGDIISRWEGFGWLAREIEGHNIEGVARMLRWAGEKENRPKVVIARTIKGKGVSFMENDNSWHQRGLTIEEMKQAELELLG